MANHHNDDGQGGKLIEAVYKLVGVGERVGSSLARVESLLVDMLRKREEDRVESKHRQKQYDEEREQSKLRQKKWDDEDRWLKNPWILPSEIARILFAVAFVALAIGVCILGSR